MPYHRDAHPYQAERLYNYNLARVGSVYDWGVMSPQLPIVALGSNRLLAWSMEDPLFTVHFLKVSEVYSIK